MEGFVYQSDQTNPYVNLTIETYLADICRRTGKSCLYLWINDKSVVIGRHQNLYDECNVKYAYENGIYLVRRETGGGAVYQDLNNLNFTIIVKKSEFDRDLSTAFIAAALNNIGIDATVDGRNDICIGDHKISGNAFLSDEKIGLHHGTLLYDTDVDMMGKVLTVSQKKLRKRGISSVKSRVVGIKKCYPDITLDAIKEAIIHVYAEKIDNKLMEPISIDVTDDHFRSVYNRLSSKKWIVGNYDSYKLEREVNFSWGNISLLAEICNDNVKSIKFVTDAIDAELVSEIIYDLNNQISAGGDIKKVFETIRDKHPENAGIVSNIQILVSEYL